MPDGPALEQLAPPPARAASRRRSAARSRRCRPRTRGASPGSWDISSWRNISTTFSSGNSPRPPASPPGRDSSATRWWRRAGADGAESSPTSPSWAASRRLRRIAGRASPRRSWARSASASTPPAAASFTSAPAIRPRGASTSGSASGRSPDKSSAGPRAGLGRTKASRPAGPWPRARLPGATWPPSSRSTSFRTHACSRTRASGCLPRASRSRGAACAFSGTCGRASSRREMGDPPE